MLLAFCAAGGALAQAELDFSIELNPATRELRGRGVIIAPANASALVLGERFELVRGAPPGAVPKREGSRRVWPLPKASGPRRIEVEWRGRLARLEGEITHRDTLTRVEPTADARGSFLPAEGDWHPAIDGASASYRIAIELPADQRAVVPGQLLDESQTDRSYRARFENPYAASGIDLIAGPYRVATREMQSVDGRAIALRAYFHAEIEGLAAGYLEDVQRYVARYERAIGAYPYTEFSVVSSPTPTGFGMPGLTYLGIEVLRLPFIRATSLGHEVLHSWWGNGVRPDYARGNWSEGLTTFMADYAYREDAGAEAARAMRLEWLRDFAAMPAGADRPLAAFTARTHGASQIVGYHKAAMTFFMVRDRIGREAFDKALRAFWRTHRHGVASWDDLRRAFEAAGGEPLKPFFDLWLTRTGAPAVRLAGAEPMRKGERHAVRVTLAQSAPPWKVRVPVVIRTDRGDIARGLELASERQTFAIDLDAPAKAVALDPELKLLRRLAADESPPILRQVMIEPNVALIVPTPAMAKNAGELAQRIVERAPRREPADAKPPATALLIVGSHDDVDAWLERNRVAPRPGVVARRGSAQVWTTSREGNAVAVISAENGAALAALARPLPHYGRQSWLVFEGAKALDRGVWPARPQEVQIAEKP